MAWKGYLAYQISKTFPPYSKPWKAPAHPQQEFWTSSKLPIGIWLQNPKNAKFYQSIGINFYLGLWQGPTQEQLDLLREHQMPVVCHWNSKCLNFIDHPSILAWMLPDEPDNDQKRENTSSGLISPLECHQLYSNIRQLDPTRPVWLNLGQGFANPLWNGRGPRNEFHEDYPWYIQCADLISFDFYPFAHSNPSMKGNLKLYIQSHHKLQELLRPSQSSYAFIECTNIHGYGQASSIEIQAEIWSALLLGAQGIVYFAHTIHPKFNEFTLIQDNTLSDIVKQINHSIQTYWPILDQGDPLDPPLSSSPSDLVMIKFVKYKGSNYLFLLNTDTQKQKITFKKGTRFYLLNTTSPIKESKTSQESIDLLPLHFGIYKLK